MLCELLQARAVELGLIEPGTTIDAERAFLLVRDMPYARASSREPEVIIGEWRGTMLRIASAFSASRALIPGSSNCDRIPNGRIKQ